MSDAKWRSPAVYEHVRSLDAAGFAWEFVNRNPEFQRDCKGLADAREQGAPTAGELDSFTRRWGCDFVIPDSDGGTWQPLWNAASLPSVIPIGRIPAALAHPNHPFNAQFLIPALAGGGPGRLIEHRGNLFRLHVLEQTGAQTPCVVLPLDRFFETRAAAALRFWRSVNGRSPGRDPATLPASRRERLLLALRALDGRLDGASYREIAACLFGSHRMPNRGWKTHDLRDRTVRLSRLGFAMMQGGYRRLLLYPVRARI